MVKTGSIQNVLVSQTAETFGMASPTTSFQVSPVNPLQLHPVTRTVDHLLVKVGAHVAVVSPDEGMAANAYASARPHWQVTAWVPDMKTLLRGQGLYTTSNLLFDKMPLVPKHNKEPVDAIIAVGWAHRVFSDNQYNLSAVMLGLQNLLQQLETHGQVLVQDFALPDDADDFVLLDIDSPSAAAALVDFASIARPQAPQPLQGFFLESVESPRGGVQRFRLQSKWATEFFHRWRLGIAPDAPYELTTLDLNAWGSLAEQCGARATYLAPHPLPEYEREKLGNVMRFYSADEKPLPLPAGTFTAVFEKLSPHDAVALYERRPSSAPPKDIVLKTQKDEKTNTTTAWVDVNKTFDDMLVWRMVDDHLLVWVQTNVPRPIVNTVPRGTHNLDGRRWAGYLTEPLAVTAYSGPLEQSLIKDMLTQLTGVESDGFKDEQVAMTYYAAPEYLAQRVRGLWVETTKPLPQQERRQTHQDNPGELIEVAADDVLRAISVGLIPDSKLEILISSLMQEKGLRPREMGEALTDAAHKKIMHKLTGVASEVKGYRKVKPREDLNDVMSDSAEGSIRSIRSVFVEDQASPMGRQSTRVAEYDFIIPGRFSANSAVCIPLSKNPMGRFLVGTEPRKLPIPNRMGDAEPMLSLPSFRLPESITTMDEARHYLAKMLECSPEDLSAFGPSFFIQPHLSPERIYPFLLHAGDNGYTWERLIKPRENLQRIVERVVEKSAAYICMKAQRDLGEWFLGFSPDLSHDMTARAAPVEKLELPRNDNVQSTKPRLDFD
jgi:hypothetical protein